MRNAVEFIFRTMALEIWRGDKLLAVSFRFAAHGESLYDVALNRRGRN